MSTLRGSSCRTNFLSALRGACAKPIFSAFQDGKTFCYAVAVVTGTAIAFFLNCFPMAQPPGEAPDRNQKKTATNVCAKPKFSALQDGKTFCFAVAVVTGTAIAFSSLFSHGPATR